MRAPIDNYTHQSYPTGSVTQWFGLNPALYGKICHEYCMAGHNGIDIVAPWGTKMYAVKDGVIGNVKNDPNGYGKHLRLFHDRGDGFVEEWPYGHCSKIVVSEGQVAKEGDYLADMGNTGFVVSGATPFWKYNPYAGTHLHLGKRLWKKWDGTGTYQLTVGNLRLVGVVDYRNGYFGYVDFSEELKIATGGGDTPGEAALRLTLQSLRNQLKGLIK